MSPHTPGPWRVGSKVPLNIYDGDGRPVCQVHREEDARAIVAAINSAPDLLGACKYLLNEYIEELGNCRCAGDVAPCAACDGRAAIAKATGGAA